MPRQKKEDECSEVKARDKFFVVCTGSELWIYPPGELPRQMEVFVARLIYSGRDNRPNRAVERAVKPARFRCNAALEDVD